MGDDSDDSDASALDAGSADIDSSSDCDTLCKALESMKRAADRICALAGESSDRCRSARSRVREATRKVVDAGCNCGSGGDAPPISSTDDSQ
jgi:hypothetical protein